MMADARRNRSVALALIALAAGLYALSVVIVLVRG